MALATSSSLAEWLARIERLHPATIAMGLERVAAVRDRLHLSPSFPLIVVGGTNGKGSICAMLESIYVKAGFSTGLYTSPHLLRYNERVRVDGREVGDAELVDAFAQVDAARADIPLTYFEFGTLAAQVVFCRRGVDVAILEVGLGGRLDAVNAFEPACSVVASVSIDHVDYLGPDRESIGFEKAGIFRNARPALCADHDPPASLLAHAASIGADLYLIDRDYGYTRTNDDWRFWSLAGNRHALPHPALRGSYQLDNAATALQCVHLLHDRLPVDMGALRDGLVGARLPARFQVLPARPIVILDVAHNAAAAQALAATLGAMPGAGKTFAVFAALADKPVEEICLALANQIEHWFVCGLAVPRAAGAGEISQRMHKANGRVRIDVCADVASGLAAAQEVAGDNDRILVFGSFYTVSDALRSSEVLSALAGC